MNSRVSVQSLYTILALMLFFRRSGISGHFTKDYFGPDSTRSFFLSIGRIFAKIVRNLRALSSTTLYIRGKIWRDRLSPPRVGYRKSDRLVFLNMLKNSSLSKTVVPWSSWSSERPMKVPLSRPPLELSYCFCRGSCVVSTECKHPTLTRSSDDQDDHGTTVFIGYCF